MFVSCYIVFKMGDLNLFRYFSLWTYDHSVSLRIGPGVLCLHFSKTISWVVQIYSWFYMLIN